MMALKDNLQSRLQWSRKWGKAVALLSCYGVPISSHSLSYSYCLTNSMKCNCKCIRFSIYSDPYGLNPAYFSINWMGEIPHHQCPFEWLPHQLWSKGTVPMKISGQCQTHMKLIGQHEKGYSTPLWKVGVWVPMYPRNSTYECTTLMV